MMVALLLTGASFGLWRLTFAGLIGGGLPQSDTGSGPRLLVTEFGLNQDTLWAISADEPDRRQPVATLPHAPGYGAYASVSADGGSLAYTALPPGLKNPAADSPAEVWLLDLSTGQSRVLAADADLLVTPVWAPDGRSLVFRRSYPQENAAGSFELVRVDLTGGETAVAKAEAGLFPIGFAPDGTFLYTAVSPTGTDLMRAAALRADVAAERLAHLSDEFTREWRLSPDGRELAFLAPQVTNGGMVLRAMVADLSRGAGQVSVRLEVADGALAQEFGPVWHPDGDLTLGRLSPGQSRAGALRLSAQAEDGAAEALPRPDRGFDVPISWSPDGDVLAVRTFENASPVQPGRARLELVQEDGGRRPIEMGSEVSVAGWLTGE